jgi:hypothetical protein
MLDKAANAAHDALLATGICWAGCPNAGGAGMRRTGDPPAAFRYETWAMSKIEFKSHVPVAQKPALEALLFFNSCQERVSACIADAIEKFGAPEIVADRDRLRIHMKDLPEVQSLFAMDTVTGRPVGVAVYARQDIEHVTVVHVGITAEFASGGPRSSEQLLLKLLREVRRSTRRVKGVRSMDLYYATGRTSVPRWRAPAKVMM